MIPNLRLALVIVLCLAVYSAAQDSTAGPDKPDSGPPVNVSNLYLKVSLDSAVKVSKLKPGDEVSGKLFQDVYQGNIDVFPASSAVRLTVDRLEHRRRPLNDHWPWVIKAFTPRHENWPVFRTTSVMDPNGRRVPLDVSIISVNKEVEIAPKAKKNSGSAMPEVHSLHRTRSELGSLVTLIASAPLIENGNVNPSAPPPVTIPSGTEAKVVLLRDISASKNHANDTFQARLVEPVLKESKILLPEGTLFEGRVLRSRAPRTLSRSGSILLTFTNMTVPGGKSSPVAASVGGAQINQGSHTVIDPEGLMHGDRPGKAWMLVNIGTTAGIAKLADDGSQLLIEALVSTATDVSTAGTARIISTCVSGIFFLTRHGRDVVLPKYTQMKIIFDRPVPASNPTLSSVTGN